jgi:lauroyl/myristoyl acyltransferase
LRVREFRVRGKHQVDPLFAEGRGIIMVTAHVGPWDTAAMGLGLDVPVLMLMSPEEDDAAGDLQDQLRESAHVRVLRVGESGLDALPILEHLRDGGVVVAQLDRVPPGRTPLWVDLFEHPFAMPQGLFRLAGAANVPLVPVFAARLPDGRDLVDVGPPIFVPKGTRGLQLLPFAQRTAAGLEAHLAAFPTQWFHFSEMVPRSAQPLGSE